MAKITPNLYLTMPEADDYMDPQVLADNFKKIDDGWASAYAIQVKISASIWSATAPFQATITWPGMHSGWCPGSPVAASTGNLERDLLILDNAAKINRIDTEQNRIVFTCYTERPSVDLTLNIPRLRM